MLLELAVVFRDDTYLVNDQWTPIQADAYAALAKVGPACIDPGDRYGVQAAVERAIDGLLNPPTKKPHLAETRWLAAARFLALFRTWGVDVLPAAARVQRAAIAALGAPQHLAFGPKEAVAAVRSDILSDARSLAADRFLFDTSVVAAADPPDVFAAETLVCSAETVAHYRAVAARVADPALPAADAEAYIALLASNARFTGFCLKFSVLSYELLVGLLATPERHEAAYAALWGCVQDALERLRTAERAGDRPDAAKTAAREVCFVLDDVLSPLVDEMAADRAALDRLRAIYSALIFAVVSADVDVRVSVLNILKKYTQLLN